jgi:CheY-like chemotaxis protein
MSTRLLLITNDLEMTTTVQELLASHSLEIVVKNTLRRAAQFLVQEDTPEVVLLDLSAHMSDGFDFLRKIRSIKRFAQLPIVVTVEDPDPDVIKDALQVGANRYLTQSFIQTNLLRTLRDMRIINR